MTRAALLLAFSVLLAGCAGLEAQVTAQAVPAAARVTDEVDCMADCLQDNAEDCETCAVHCLGHTPDTSSTHADDGDGEPEVADNTA